MNKGLFFFPSQNKAEPTYGFPDNPPFDLKGFKGFSYPDNKTFYFTTVTGAWSIFNPAFSISFGSPQRVLIDYGDGSPIFEWNVSNGRQTTPNYTYGSGFGAGIKKRIKFTFERIDDIVNIEIARMGLVDEFPSNFIDFVNLTSLLVLEDSGFNTLSSFPMNFLEMQKLTSIDFRRCFNAQSGYLGQIPSSFFNKPIQTLGYVDLNLGSRSLEDNNLNKIYLLKETITALTLLNNSITELPLDPANGLQLCKKLTSITVSGNSLANIPNGLEEIPALINLNISSNLFVTKIPDSIGLITQLQTLGCGNGGLSTFTNMELLVNLTGLNVDGDTVFVPTLTSIVPANFSALTKLKSFFARRTYATSRPDTATHNVNTFIDSVYTWITTNAAISGASSLPFRGITFNVTGNGAPTGIFQMPAGYVAGVSNGSPASSLEKVWVLVNQYGHTWTYS